MGWQKLGLLICMVATLILAGILLIILPAKAELSEGFLSPIIAFEFARSEADLAFLAGASQQAQGLRSAMRLGLQYDMIFPFAYAGFIFFLILAHPARAKWFTMVGAVIALTIVALDLNENRVMLNILDALDQSVSPGPPLAQLYLATWLKWGAIALAILFLALGLWQKNKISAGMALLVPLISVACLLSNSKPILTELMALVVSVFFLFFAVKAVFLFRKKL